MMFLVPNMSWVSYPLENLWSVIVDPSFPDVQCPLISYKLRYDDAN